MRWPATRPATAARSKVCSSATSASNLRKFKGAPSGASSLFARMLLSRFSHLVLQTQERWQKFRQPSFSQSFQSRFGHYKKVPHSQSPLSQCFCHEVDLIICVALFCVKWLSFTSFNKKNACRKQTLQYYSSSYRAVISSSASFIFAFTLSGPTMRTALPRPNIQPKNCWLTATETTTRK